MSRCPGAGRHAALLLRTLLLRHGVPSRRLRHPRCTHVQNAIRLLAADSRLCHASQRGGDACLLGRSVNAKFLASALFFRAGAPARSALLPWRASRMMVQPTQTRGRMHPSTPSATALPSPPAVAPLYAPTRSRLGRRRSSVSQRRLPHPRPSGPYHTPTRTTATFQSHRLRRGSRRTQMQRQYRHQSLFAMPLNPRHGAPGHTHNHKWQTYHLSAPFLVLALQWLPRWLQRRRCTEAAVQAFLSVLLVSRVSE